MFRVDVHNFAEQINSEAQMMIRTECGERGIKILIRR